MCIVEILENIKKPPFFLAHSLGLSQLSPLTLLLTPSSGLLQWVPTTTFTMARLLINKGSLWLNMG